MRRAHPRRRLPRSRRRLNPSKHRHPSLLHLRRARRSPRRAPSREPRHRPRTPRQGAIPTSEAPAKAKSSARRPTPGQEATRTSEAPAKARSSVHPQTHPRTLRHHPPTPTSAEPARAKRSARSDDARARRISAPARRPCECRARRPRGSRRAPGLVPGPNRTPPDRAVAVSSCIRPRTVAISCSATAWPRSIDGHGCRPGRPADDDQAGSPGRVGRHSHRS